MGAYSRYKKERKLRHRQRMENFRPMSEAERQQRMEQLGAPMVEAMTLLAAAKMRRKDGPKED